MPCLRCAVRQLFGSSENAVEVDGALFREEHTGWQAVAQHGYSAGVLHEEAWGIFKQHSGSTKLKKRIIAGAMEARQHLIIPDTMNAPDKVEELVTQLVDAGYAMHAVCLWAPLAATRRRGEPRSIREGKLWSPADYSKSTVGTLAMARRFAAGIRETPSTWRSVSCWDNSVFPATRCTLEDFAALTALDDTAAESHLRSLKFQSQKRAARYSVVSPNLGLLATTDDPASPKRTSGSSRLSGLLPNWSKGDAAVASPNAAAADGCDAGVAGASQPSRGLAASVQQVDVEAPVHAASLAQGSSSGEQPLPTLQAQAVFGTPGGRTLSDKRHSGSGAHARMVTFTCGGFFGLAIGAVAAALITKATCAPLP